MLHFLVQPVHFRMREATQEEIHKDRVRHQNPYRHATKNGFQAKAREKPVVDSSIHLNPEDLRDGKPVDSEFSKQELENIARRLQIRLYKKKDRIPAFGESAGPLDILKPALALQQIGYQCEEVDALGRFEVGTKRFEIAGVIEDSKRRVQVSAGQPDEVKNFTTAHELAHALLHNSARRHRDRPLSSTSTVQDRGRKEWEADKFAAYFVMPAKQVIQEFEDRFSGPLTLTDNTAFKLNADPDSSGREFSRAVAAADNFGGPPYFSSLSEVFNVSIEAMAIRLEELGLVKTE